MRLNRLDLIRYGRFDGAEIRFPRHTDGTRDVTVIYGPNEAGKSTAFSGYLELLFGMKVQHHPYAFRYERNDLLVGPSWICPGAVRWCCGAMASATSRWWMNRAVRCKRRS